jgi:hypothetical protein
MINKVREVAAQRDELILAERAKARELEEAERAAQVALLEQPAEVEGPAQESGAGE